MEEIVVAIGDFGAQPLGVVGVLFVMSASTIINSTQVAGWLERRRVPILLPYNGFNLIGAVSLLGNAVLQDEMVWLMLEIYLIGIAVKGLIQANRHRQGATSGLTVSPVAVPSSEADRPPADGNVTEMSATGVHWDYRQSVQARLEVRPER